MAVRSCKPSRLLPTRNEVLVGESFTAPKSRRVGGSVALEVYTTMRFNRRHRCTGHLFQGRYQAIVVERGGHILELSSLPGAQPCAGPGLLATGAMALVELPGDDRIPARSRCRLSVPVRRVARREEDRGPPTSPPTTTSTHRS